MERIKLVTAEGALVGYATLVPFEKPSEGVILGQRSFFLDPTTKDKCCPSNDSADPEKMVVYREGLMVPVFDFSGDPKPSAGLFTQQRDERKGS